MHETNLVCGIYLQKGDLLVYPNKFGLVLLSQWDERTIDAKYAKALTLNTVDSPKMDSPCDFRVRLIRSGSDVLLSIESIHLDQYRLSLDDATTLVGYINRVAPAMWV